MKIFKNEKIKLVCGDEFEYTTFAKQYIEIEVGDMVCVYDYSTKVENIDFDMDKQQHIIELCLVSSLFDFEMSGVQNGLSPC